MDSCDREDSDLQQELEVLQEIYINELKVDRDSSGYISCISLQLHPATGDQVDQKWVCLTLILKPSLMYPNDVPEIDIRNPRGLSEEYVSRLQHKLDELAKAKKGECMLFELIELAKDSLTQGNLPHGECVICKDGFSEEEYFTKTQCYHYFHCHCLLRYVTYTEQEIQEDYEAAVRLSPHVKVEKKEVMCPVCRAPLTYDLAQLSKYPGQDDLDPCSVIISPEVRLLQKQMSALFQKQKEKGGIIDLQAEKDRFLVTSTSSASHEIVNGLVTTAENCSPNCPETGQEKNESTSAVTASPSNSSNDLSKSCTSSSNKKHADDSSTKRTHQPANEEQTKTRGKSNFQNPMYFDSRNYYNDRSKHTDRKGVNKSRNVNNRLNPDRAYSADKKYYKTREEVSKRSQATPSRCSSRSDDTVVSCSSQSDVLDNELDECCDGARAVHSRQEDFNGDPGSSDNTRHQAGQTNRSHYRGRHPHRGQYRSRPSGRHYHSGRSQRFEDSVDYPGSTRREYEGYENNDVTGTEAANDQVPNDRTRKGNYYHETKKVYDRSSGFRSNGVAEELGAVTERMKSSKQHIQTDHGVGRDGLDRPPSRDLDVSSKSFDAKKASRSRSGRGSRGRFREIKHEAAQHAKEEGHEGQDGHSGQGMNDVTDKTRGDNVHVKPCSRECHWEVTPVTNNPKLNQASGQQHKQTYTNRTFSRGRGQGRGRTTGHHSSAHCHDHYHTNDKRDDKKPNFRSEMADDKIFCRKDAVS